MHLHRYSYTKKVQGNGHMILLGELRLGPTPYKRNMQPVRVLTLNINGFWKRLKSSRLNLQLAHILSSVLWTTAGTRTLMIIWVRRLPILWLAYISSLSYCLLIGRITMGFSVVEFHISKVTGLMSHTWYPSSNMTKTINRGDECPISGTSKTEKLSSLISDTLNKACASS